jgi:hypothetical protein
MSLVPQVVVSGSGVIVAALAFVMARKDARWARAAPFLFFLAFICIVVAVIFTLAG